MTGPGATRRTGNYDDYNLISGAGGGLLEGESFNQKETPGEFLGVEDQGVVVIAGGDGEGDIFGKPDQIAPGHVDLSDEDPSLSWVVDLFEPL